MKTNQEKQSQIHNMDLAAKIAECLTTRGSRVDWVKTEKELNRVWKAVIQGWLDAGECGPAGAAMAWSSNVSNSMKLLRKISRKASKARRELAL